MAKIPTILSLLLLPFFASGQFNPQSRSITERFFPEREYPITTPAFSKEKGFTNYAELMAWLDKTCKPHPTKATITFIGESQKGKKIPLVRLQLANGRPKTRIWLQGGLHGDEPAGTEAMLHLIDKLLNDAEYQYLLDSLDIAIVPMANIDGYEKQIRASANGIDLNRDQVLLRAPESISLKKAFSAFQPEVAVDFHEYRPYRKDFTRLGGNGITSFHDAMFLYTGNLNVPENLRTFIRTPFVKNAEDVLTKNKFTHHPYVTTQKQGGQVQFNQGSIHSRSSATNYALANTVSTLLEIRGVGIGRTSFKRRIESSFLVAVSYLKTAYDKRKELKDVLIASAASRHDVVVKSSPLISKQTIQAIDVATDKEIELPIILRDALQSTPTLKRARPFAYILLPSEMEAVNRLQILGLGIDTIRKEVELDVEAYKRDEQEEDGVVESSEDDESDNRVGSAKTGSVKRKIPLGSFVIYMNQPKSNLAAEILEPESQNGLVEGKIIKARQGQELPIYRYLTSQRIEN